MENSPELSSGKPEPSSKRSYGNPGDPMSPYQIEAWNARCENPDLSIPGLAKLLGRSRTSVANCLQYAKARMGSPPRHKPGLDERLDPDGVQLTKRHSPEILERDIRSKRISRQLKAVRTDALELLTSNVALNALESLARVTEDEWDEQPIKDRAVVAGINIDKRAILRGEPTSIVEVRDHRRLDEVASALLQEIKRRGISIDADFTSTQTDGELAVEASE